MIESGSDSTKNKPIKTFRFDNIFTPETSQSIVYEKTGKKLVQDILQGYNGTIFAYGQTGSGKTYTMMGNNQIEAERGIIPRCFKDILDNAKQSQEK